MLSAAAQKVASVPGISRNAATASNGAAVEKAVEIAGEISEVRQQGRSGQEKCRERSLLHASEEYAAEDDVCDGNEDGEDDKLDRENDMDVDRVQRQQEFA